MMRDESIISGRLAVPIGDAAAYLGLLEEELWELIDSDVLPVIRRGLRPNDWTITTRNLLYIGSRLGDPHQPIPYTPLVQATDDHYWPAAQVTLKSPPGVYVLQSDRYFKIGCSTSPFIRVMNQAGATPYPVRCIALIRYPDPGQLEYSLHTKFARKRMNGEWFCLAERDVRYLLCLADRMVRNKLHHIDPRRYWWNSTTDKTFSSILDAIDALVHRKP